MAGNAPLDENGRTLLAGLSSVAPHTLVVPVAVNPVTHAMLIDGTSLYASLDTRYIQKLTDPNADRLLFWDDSAGAYAFLTLGTNLSITDTTINAAGGSGSGDVVAPATNTDSYIPQWNGANSKTLKDGLAVPAGGLAGLTALGGKASVALDNLASVAINTSLISDTDSTDDLGSSSKYWANGYLDKVYLNSTATLDGSVAGTVSVLGDISLANSNKITLHYSDSVAVDINTYNHSGEHGISVPLLNITAGRFDFDPSGGKVEFRSHDAPTFNIYIDGVGAYMSLEPNSQGYFRTGLSINNDSQDIDTVIKGDTATSLLYIDAGLDAVQIGTTVAGAIADFRAASIVLNEAGADLDIRMEGDTDANLLYLDAGNNRIGIGTAAPQSKLSLDISGTTNNITGDYDTGVTSNLIVGAYNRTWGLKGYIKFIETSTGADNDSSFELHTNHGGIGDAIGLKQDRDGNVSIGDDHFLNVSGAAIFNEQGADADLRVEGDTDVNLLFLDASTDRVGIGNAAPAVKLDVTGEIRASVTGTNAASVVLVGGTQTLTSKTLTSPVINTGVSGTAIDTDGTLAANSDTILASQKATKTYADTKKLSSKIITATRVMTAASGDVSYTGVGFTPTSLIALGNVDGLAIGISWGISDSGKVNESLEVSSTGAYYATGTILQLNNGGGVSQSAIIKSYDADGFTLTWTKAGSPTGTANLLFLCHK